MEYKVVFVEKNSISFATMDLEKKVNALIKEGWKPQGGISISKWDDGTFIHITLSQAMIRE